MARSVGEVYVTVLANTTTFQKQVKQAARQAADDAGTSIDERLSGQFRESIKEWYGDAETRRIADRTGADLANRFGLGFDRSFKDIRLTKQLSDALEDLAEESGEDFDKLLKKTIARIGPAYEAELRRIQTEAEAENVRRTRERERVEERLAATIRRTGNERVQQVQTQNLIYQTQIGLTKTLQDIDRARLATTQQLTKVNESSLTRITKQTKVDVDRDPFAGFLRGLTRMRSSLRAAGTGGWFDNLTNMLAIFPSMVVGISRLSLKLIKFPVKIAQQFTTWLGEMATTAGARLASAGGALGKFGAVLSRVGPALVAAAGPIAAVGSAIGAIVVPVAVLGTVAIFTKMLGVLASALTATVGVISLFAQTLTYAAGSLAAFIPLLAGLVTAGATLVIAFNGVPDAIGALNSALNETDPEKRAAALEKYEEALRDLAPAAADAVRALRPLIEGFKDVQKEIQQRVFQDLAEEIEGLEDTFKIVEEGLLKTSTTMNGVIKNLAAELRTGEFKNDLSNIFTNLQPIIDSLGRSVGNFFVGLTGFIDALLPSGKRLSGSIESASESFKEFTQSATGKNKIAEFMEKAQDAASTLMAILGTVGETIGTVFGATDEIGQGFLDKILIQAQEFKAWIDERVADGRLEAWFRDVEAIAGDVWGAIEEIVHTIDRLDTAENREALQGLLQGFQDILGFVQDDFIPAMERVWDWMEPVRSGFGGALDALVDGFQGFIDIINGDWSGLGPLLVAPIRALFAALAELPFVGHLFEPALNLLDAMAGEAGEAATATETLTGTLQGLVGQGAITSQQMDLILSDKPLPEWPDSMWNSLFDLYAQGVIDNETFNQMLGERALPGWGDTFREKMEALAEAGIITDQELQVLLQQHPIPNWPEETMTAIDHLRASGELTEPGLADLVSDRPVPGWPTDTAHDLGIEALAADGVASSVRGIPEDWYTLVDVTDGGSASAVQSSINSIYGKDVLINVRYNTPDGLRPSLVAGAATGGLFTNPQHRIIGENGPEAVIPLTRPLGQVDQSVRGLAALIRGGDSKQTVSGGTGGGKTVNVTMNVYPQTADPEAVAASVVNRAVVLSRG